MASSTAYPANRGEARPAAEGTPKMTAAEYGQLQSYVHGEFGLALGPGKEQMVLSRLGAKLRGRSFKEYFDGVRQDGSGRELVELIDALTTNHTTFFREQSHFEYMTTEVLPGLPAAEEVWFWSAASSTGEEPYSLAMWLREHGARPERFRILATDISTRVLEQAERGVYPDAKLEGIPPAWRPKYLLRGEGRQAGNFRMRPEVRAMVRFERLNLVRPPLRLADFGVTAKFPLIFCRNVMIYFDSPTQERLLRELAQHLAPGGYLYVGHSESLSRLDQPLTYVRPAVYRKAEEQ